jgi:putative membrane-bound dehydrogenase-like protein
MVTNLTHAGGKLMMVRRLDLDLSIICLRSFILPVALLTCLNISLVPAASDEVNQRASSAIDAAPLRDQPLTIEESIKAFQLAPGFKIELVASEPQITDPVSIRFDHQGRMWVVEMNDYPEGPLAGEPYRGRIKVIEDKNRDGYFETATLFADELVFPTGLQPFRDGVIVTLAGEIVYLADRNADNVCDHRERWFEGFSKENEQLRANHPTWTLENQIHVASGLRGGEIRSLNASWAPDDKSRSLASRDFQFSPFGGEWQVVAGNSQYGFYQDNTGRNYVCSNRNPCDLILAEVQQVDSNPLMPLTQWTVNVMPAAEQSQVYPLINAWTTSHLHAGTFTAACGVFRYESDLLSDQLGGDFFACEPTGSLIQRYRTVQTSIVPTTARAHERGEFLASTDSWFRPVDLTDGPDGAMYVVDMHRAVIEHPDWMPVELQSRSDMRWGNQAGRIYRVISAEPTPPREVLVDFETIGPSGWVDQLRVTNRWTGATAARLLAEYIHQGGEMNVNGSSHSRIKDADKIAIFRRLRRLFTDGNASQSSGVGISRALWLLESVGELQANDIRIAATHLSPDVRRQALRLLARHTEFENELETVRKTLANDPTPSVRFQWLLEFAAKAQLHDVEHLVEASPLFASMSQEDKHWVRCAVSLLSDKVAVAFIRESLSRETYDQSMFTELIKRLGWSGSQETLQWLLERNATARPKAHESSMLFNSFAEGMILRNRRWDDVTGALSKPALKRLQSLQANDFTIVRSALNSRTDRKAALRRIGLSRTSDVETLCRQLLANDESELYGEALTIAKQLPLDGIENELVARVTQLKPHTASLTIQALADHVSWSSVLVDAMEAGKIPWGMIDPISMGKLERHSDTEIADRIKALKANRIPEDRKALILRYRDTLNGEPDLTSGEQAFAKNCANCHHVGNQGIAVGPDISDLRTQTPEQILVSILDPNFAIDANYFRYSVLTLDGQVIEGLLEDSSDSSITLKMQESKQRIISRDQIESVHATGLSMMPEGFENQLSPEAMRDLIAYLKRWRLATGTIPYQPSSR